MAHQTVADEQYVFKPSAKKSIFILLVVGIAFLALGLLLGITGGGGRIIRITTAIMITMIAATIIMMIAMTMITEEVLLKPMATALLTHLTTKLSKLLS